MWNSRKERWETKTDRHIQRPGAVRREEVIDAAGYNTFIFESSQANIQLLSDETYKENNTLFKHCMEKDLVHELLHCKYDWMGCQGGTYEGVYLDATEHQKLEEMAKSLIMAKYGVGYDYFM